VGRFEVLVEYPRGFSVADTTADPFAKHGEVLLLSRSCFGIPRAVLFRQTGALPTVKWVEPLLNIAVCGVNFVKRSIVSFFACMNTMELKNAQHDGALIEPSPKTPELPCKKLCHRTSASLQERLP